MFRYLPIRRINAREILDSRGNPTLEVEVTVGEGIIGIDGYTGRAMVPSGASTGSYEAVELRDKDKRYRGKGVTKAVEHVTTQLAEVLVGENALNQEYIDHLLQETDGTDNKHHLGANAVLGTSLAVARAAAKALRIPLYRYLGGCYTPKMPVPMMNLINGGAHISEGSGLDFQEILLIPGRAESFSEALRMGTEIYHSLRTVLQEKGYNTAVGDEGGFAPAVREAREAFALLSEAVKRSGYRCGEDVFFAMDAAASELYDRKRQSYVFKGEGSNKQPLLRTTGEMIEYYEHLTEEFPLISIEDGLREDDWEGWQTMTRRLGHRVQLVGDDLFVTNPARVKGGLRLQVANAVLVKPNQIGTLTEAMETIRMAQCGGYATIISHRSGDTEDTFIADLAVACGAGQIKTGAPCRTERTAKYNQLLRIEEYMGCVAGYDCPFCPEKLE